MKRSRQNSEQASAAAPQHMTPLVVDADSTIGSALFLGAHCDDIEIGCGGTIQKLVAHVRTSGYTASR